MPFLRLMLLRRSLRTKCIRSEKNPEEIEEKEHGKRGKENLVQIFWTRVQIVLESLNLYVDPPVFCGKKATCSAQFRP